MSRVIHDPASATAECFTKLAGTIARKLAVIAQESAQVADANITWIKG